MSERSERMPGARAPASRTAMGRGGAAPGKAISGRRALLALVAAATVAAGCGFPGQQRGPVELTTTFSDVGDLVVAHSVQVADVRVGSITGIELTDDFNARVTLEIEERLDLPADSVAVLRQTSLLGEKFVELRPRDDDDVCPRNQPTDGGTLGDGDVITCAIEAPELEFVAEEAVQVLAGVVTDDLVTMIQTGAVGFGGRGDELGSLVEDLSTISRTLADQTGTIVSLIDGLDAATQTLAGAPGDLDQLLVNLADATTVLAENRDQAINTIRELTEFARAQSEIVFEPYLDQTQLQLEQLDRILALVDQGRAEVGALLDWLQTFMVNVPQTIPCRAGGEVVEAPQPCSGDFAQVFGWFLVPGIDL
ncbi:MAG: MlaD family protein [Acidimicrobiales bacterium]